MDIGPPELIIVAVLLLVLFGGSQIPKLARNLGQAKTQFEKGLKDAREEAAVEQKPAEQKPAEQKPAEQQPAAEKPAEQPVSAD